MFTEILICSDGSDQALQAAQATVELSSRFHSHVTLLSVFNPSALLTPFMNAPDAAPDMESILAMGEETQTTIHQKTGKILETAGIPYQSRRENGHPVEKIVAVAQSLNSDLIVLGSRGLSEWKALLMGSVSDGVLHHASCPVMIVRTEQTTFPRILLASDGSAGAYQATLAAGALARKFGAPLTILNVLEPLGPLAHAFSGADGEIRSRHVREVLAQRIRCVAEQASGNYTILQKEGPPAETIVTYAREHAFPLIVLGSRGMSALQALAMGSISDRVAHHAHCSVLVVR